jgi:hypothetical protein
MFKKKGLILFYKLCMVRFEATNRTRACVLARLLRIEMIQHIQAEWTLEFMKRLELHVFLTLSFYKFVQLYVRDQEPGTFSDMSDETS